MKYMGAVRSRITSVFLCPRKEEGDEKRRRVNTKNLKEFHELMNVQLFWSCDVRH